MISVVIPTFNRSKTILRAVQSVLKQDYNKLEIIIIDDNSTDDTEKIISDFKDVRIRYYKNKKNMGACYSRNKGVDLAVGEYIAFQDSDDEWLLGKLNAQYNYLKQQDCDVVFCSMLRVQNRYVQIYPNTKPDNDKSMYDQLLFDNFISTQTVFGKRKVFKDFRFNEYMPRFQDWELMLRVSKAYNIRFMDSIFVNSYIQDDSITQNSTKAIKGLNIIINKHRREIKSNKKIDAAFNIKIAEYMLISEQNPKEYYKKAFELTHSIKIFIFMLFCYFSLNRFLFRIKQNFYMVFYKK